MVDRNKCAGCPLEGKHRPRELICGDEARYLVVSDTPPEDAPHHSVFSPRASHVFMKSMKKEQFVEADFAFVPQIRCEHDADKYTTKERRLIQATCRAHLIDDVEWMKPEAILPMGAEASKQVMGRAVKITKVRGAAEVSDEFRVPVFPMLSPLQVALYPQHQSSFTSDAATFGRLVDHKFNVSKASKSVMGEYEYIDDLQFLIDMEPTLVAFDTETGGLRHYAPDNKILTMQFCVEEGKAYMLAWDHPDAPKRTGRQRSRLKRQMIDLLCHPDTKVIGQNPKFDALMMSTHLGIRYRLGHDTLMLGTLLDENAFSKSQDDLVRRYVPEMAGYADRFNATVDKSKMAEHPLDEKFLEYGCGDADSLLRLFNRLYPEVAKDPKLLAHYNHVTMPVLDAFTSIEPRGMLINEEEIDRFEVFMEQKVDEAYRSLLAQVPRSIKRAHVDKGLKFSRGDFVRDILFNHPDGFRLKPRVFTDTTAKLEDVSRRVPSTSSKDHLPFFFDECPFAEELAQYVKDERMLGTNIRGFRKKYVVDDKVRPSYRLHVAVTGRSSSDDPNGQNFPKRGATATAYRRIFRAPEGYYFVEGDESQAELRIAADMANEPTMLKIYREDGDIHVESAMIALQVSREAFFRLAKDEQKGGRQKAKAVNFGFLYGMWWKKFVHYAKTQYGVTFTDREAEQIRKDFFAKYYRLEAFHEKMKAEARKNKFVRSYSGRIRHLPMIDSPEEWIRKEAERQAVNSPIQEFASSLGLMSMARMEQEIDSEFFEIVSFVHDAIYAYVPKQYLEWGAKKLKYFMQTNPIEEWFGIKMKVPLVADVQFGENLGEMYELKGLQLDPPTLRGRAAAAYDFGKFWDEDKQTGIIVPAQRTPPHDGYRQSSPYTEWRAAA